MKITHYGGDYAYCEIGGDQHTISIGVARGIDRQRRELNKLRSIVATLTPGALNHAKKYAKIK